LNAAVNGAAAAIAFISLCYSQLGYGVLPTVFATPSRAGETQRRKGVVQRCCSASGTQIPEG